MYVLNCQLAYKSYKIYQDLHSYKPNRFNLIKREGGTIETMYYKIDGLESNFYWNKNILQITSPSLFFVLNSAFNLELIAIIYSVSVISGRVRMSWLTGSIVLEQLIYNLMETSTSQILTSNFNYFWQIETLHITYKHIYTHMYTSEKRKGISSIFNLWLHMIFYIGDLIPSQKFFLLL